MRLPWQKERLMGLVSLASFWACRDYKYTPSYVVFMNPMNCRERAWSLKKKKLFVLVFMIDQCSPLPFSARFAMICQAMGAVHVMRH